MASGLSVGVPGVLAALKLAHDKYGKLPWAELFQPAIALARDGFPISPRLAKLLAEADPQSFAPEARAYFFDAQGRPWPAGYKLTNPALADTFETIARDGPEAFYEGDIASDIAARGAERSAQAGQAYGRGSRQLPRQGARAGLRALSRAIGLRHGAIVLRRRRRGAGARHRSSRSISAPRRSARAPRI